MVKTLYYEPKGTPCFNVKLFNSGALLNRVTVRDICGLNPADIEWLWIVQEMRNATPEEIRKLCKKEKPR